MGSKASPPPKYIFFTDFDGTITLHDSNDHLADTQGFGPEKRRAMNLDVLHGRMPFRENMQAMMDSVTLPFPEVVSYLVDHVELDPHFRVFYAWCRERGIPVVILSGGMQPVIEAIVRHELGDDVGREIEVVSNGVEGREGMKVHEEGGWRIVFRDDR
jgi:2,3-diketo-5-methylthio-1-phosphopentane phosphatase